MKKVIFQGYSGYSGKYKDIEFTVFNAGFNTVNIWYFDIKNIWIDERDHCKSLKTKKQAIEYAKMLINKNL